MYTHYGHVRAIENLPTLWFYIQLFQLHINTTGGLGQRALVGKVNMDQDNDNMDQDCEYLEDIQHSVENTQTWVHISQSILKLYLLFILIHSFIRFVQDMKVSVWVNTVYHIILVAHLAGFKYFNGHMTMMQDG